jgi:hypothetical protein
MADIPASELPVDRLAKIEALVEQIALTVACLAQDFAAAQTKPEPAAQSDSHPAAARPPNGPALIVSNLRRVDKGRLVAILDLYIVGWRLHLRSVRWLRWEDGAEVIALPEREYTANSGTKRYQKINEFGDSATFQRFNKAAIEAIHVFVEKNKATEQ